VCYSHRPPRRPRLGAVVVDRDVRRLRGPVDRVRLGGRAHRDIARLEREQWNGAGECRNSADTDLCLQAWVECTGVCTRWRDWWEPEEVRVAAALSAVGD